MSNKTRRARVNDLRVGRTLYINDRNGRVTQIKLLKVIRTWLGLKITYTHPSGYKHKSEGFAGDLGISGKGERYDDRPCRLFTNRSGAMRNLPAMAKWEAEIHARNQEFPDYDYQFDDRDCEDDQGSIYELVREQAPA